MVCLLLAVLAALAWHQGGHPSSAEGTASVVGPDDVDRLGGNPVVFQPDAADGFVVPEEELPDWYAGQIRYLAQDKYKIAWLGLYLATEEPVSQYDPRELSTWLRTPLISW